MKATEDKTNEQLRRIDRGYRRDVAIVQGVPKIKRYFFAFWALLAVGLIIYALVFLVNYIAFGSFSDQRLVASTGNNTSTQHAVSVENAAGALLVDNASTFSLGENRYDFAAEVENGNEDWFATFAYHFSYSGGETQTQMGFLLPGEIKPIVQLGMELESRPASAELVLESVTWMRAEHRQIEDTTAWLADHNQFIVGNITHGVNAQVAGAQVAQTSFEITNASAYGYWSPVFLVVVKRGESILGINQVTLRGFESGETRSVSVNWFGNAPQGGEVEIIPSIPYFDEDAYMDQESGEPQEREFF